MTPAVTAAGVAAAAFAVGWAYTITTFGWMVYAAYVALVTFVLFVVATMAAEHGRDGDPLGFGLLTAFGLMLLAVSASIFVRAL